MVFICGIIIHDEAGNKAAYFYELFYKSNSKNSMTH